jgi:hypothetical protein
MGYLPFAQGRAIECFAKSLEIAGENGIFSMQGQSALRLGILHKMKNKLEPAKGYLSEAIAVLEKTDMEEDLAQARAELGELANRI